MPAPTVSAARTARLVGALAPGRPAYRALADALRLAVADGRIPVGSRLPSERELTAALDVSRTTVTRAYTVLRESGYLTSRRGSGSVASLPSGSRQRRAGSLFPADVGEGVIDLTCAATRAPAGVLEAYERAVGQLPHYLAGAGYLTFGVPELREVIAERYTARGLPTSADEVLVTSGAVAGIGIVLHALVGHGDRVVVETPGYPNTIDAARRGGARLVPLAMDPDGWDVAESARTVRAAAATAALLIPDFHNPTGALMGDDDRAVLARALRARRHRAGHRRDHRRGRPRGRPDAVAVRRARPARDHGRELVEVALGWSAHRLGAGAAHRARTAGRVPGDERPRGSGARAAGAPRADAGRPGADRGAPRRPAQLARRAGHRPGDPPARAALPGAPRWAVPLVRAARRGRRDRGRRGRRGRGAARRGRTPLRPRRRPGALGAAALRAGARHDDRGGRAAHPRRRDGAELEGPRRRRAGDAVPAVGRTGAPSSPDYRCPGDHRPAGAPPRPPRHARPRGARVGADERAADVDRRRPGR